MFARIHRTRHVITSTVYYDCDVVALLFNYRVAVPVRESLNPNRGAYEFFFISSSWIADIAFLWCENILILRSGREHGRDPTTVRHIFRRDFLSIIIICRRVYFCLFFSFRNYTRTRRDVIRKPSSSELHTVYLYLWRRVLCLRVSTPARIYYCYYFFGRVECCWYIRFGMFYSVIGSNNKSCAFWTDAF